MPRAVLSVSISLSILWISRLISSMETWLLLITSESWVRRTRELASLRRRRAACVGRIDIDKAVAQHARCGNGSRRVGMQVAQVLARPPAWYFDWIGIPAGTTRIRTTLPMVTPSSVTGAPSLVRRRSEIRNASMILCAKSPPEEPVMRKMSPISTASGGQNQCPHLQLRPLNLFAAWHVTPLAELSRSTPTAVRETGGFRAALEDLHPV